MKATEVMIGDWVSFIGSPFRVQDIFKLVFEELSVHELQHVLRLLNIDKEVVI